MQYDNIQRYEKGKTRVKRGKTLHTETGAKGAKNKGKKRCEKKAVV